MDDTAGLRQKFFDCLGQTNSPLKDGCIEMQDLNDAELESFLMSFRELINPAIAEGVRSMTFHDGGEITSYFDYFKVEVFTTAAAFGCGQYAFIGFTYRLIEEISNVAVKATISEFPCPIESIETFRQEHPIEFARLLKGAMATYVVGHELGHHVNGHVGRLAKGELIHEDSKQIGSPSRHGRELDADIYAAEFTRVNSKKQLAAFDTIACDYEIFSVLALILYRYCDTHPPFTDLQNVYSESHPPSYIRISYALARFMGNPPLIDRIEIIEKLSDWAHAVLGHREEFNWRKSHVSDDEWQRYQDEIQAASLAERTARQEKIWLKTL